MGRTILYALVIVGIAAAIAFRDEIAQFLLSLT